MENTSLFREEAPVTSNGADDFSVRCPSCDHPNPAGSHYCNRCGMPVHFEACGRCEAINLRGAACCHKCGCVLPGSAIPESAAASPAIVETPSSQAVSRLGSNADPPPEIAGTDQRRRHTGMRAALIALGLALVAVTTYLAMEHPASFHRMLDGAPRGDVVADSPAPTSGPSQPPPAGPPSELVNSPRLQHFERDSIGSRRAAGGARCACLGQQVERIAIQARHFQARHSLAQASGTQACDQVILMRLVASGACAHRSDTGRTTESKGPAALPQGLSLTRSGNSFERSASPRETLTPS